MGYSVSRMEGRVPGAPLSSLVVHNSPFSLSILSLTASYGWVASSSGTHARALQVPGMGQAHLEMHPV